MIEKMKTMSEFIDGFSKTTKLSKPFAGFCISLLKERLSKDGVNVNDSIFDEDGEVVTEIHDFLMSPITEIGYFDGIVDDPSLLEVFSKYTSEINDILAWGRNEYDAGWGADFRDIGIFYESWFFNGEDDSDWKKDDVLFLSENNRVLATKLAVSMVNCKFRRFMKENDVETD